MRPRSSAPARSGWKTSRTSSISSGVTAALTTRRSDSRRVGRGLGPAACCVASERVGCRGHAPIVLARAAKLLTPAREDHRHFLFAEDNYHGPTASARSHRPTHGGPRRAAAARGGRGHAGAAARRRRARGRRPSSRRCRPTPTPSPARWARTIQQRRRAGPGRLPVPGQRAARRRRRAPRPHPPSRAPTSSGGARPAAGAAPTRCSRPSASAPGCRGASCRATAVRDRRRRQAARRLRRAGLRLHRRAVGGRRRRSHRRAGHHRPGAPAAARPGRPRTCSPASTTDVVLDAAERAGWVPPHDAHRRAGAGGAGPPGRPRGRPRHPGGRRRAAELTGGSTRPCCCWCPTPTATAAPRCCGPPPAAAAWSARPSRGWRPARPSTARCGPAPLGARRRHRGPPDRPGAHRRRRRPRRPARPGARAAGRPQARRAPRSSPTPCGPGCCTRAAATTSPPRSSCTRRPCATAWASCASSTASASRTPRWCSRWRWPSACWSRTRRQGGRAPGRARRAGPG